ncbi:MAG: glycosyl hydrolase family 18 protein [Bacteroidales bacterium]|nr:glycosyl hydrolase family 18 protein [Bacteroidales bacterium]MCM1416188.1 glycosyl hydrolase family 18 protein [bacterium]MCM1424213.1 glycosyl hydrolase family 18 protein [bacterium]
MKKVIPVIVAIVLIILIAAAGFGAKLLEKYSYSKERADLTEYFDIQGENDVPIILQDERIAEHAKIFDNICYFDIATVHQYFNERFYEDKAQELLLYTTPEAILTTQIGGAALSKYDAAFAETPETFDYAISRREGETLYIAADFVQQYANFSYELFTEPNRMQVYTEWGERQTVPVLKDTQVRYQGGIKSDILTDVSEGDTVIVLEEMENWTKVKTRDSFIGYVENKRLGEKTAETTEPVSHYDPVYESNTRDHKINLGFHSIGSVDGNDTLESAVAQTKGLNVISPTWFTLTGNEGEFSSFAGASYVERAHEMGLEVWALVGNVESVDVDMYELLSRTGSRWTLIKNLIAAAQEYGLDGLNIDFENLSLDAGEPFVQFIRELSIPCREYGIVLSVDNFVPMAHTDHYNRAEQGRVADYVIVMGYDEHYNGSKEAGSVASIDFVERGIKNTVAEVPAEKVINALPFYTRLWETKGTSVTSQAVGMEMAQTYVSDHDIAIRWDETTCQNYGEFQSESGFCQVWLEDADSIRVKLNIMENYDIGGVAAWRLGFETPDVWDVIADYMN